MGLSLLDGSTAHAQAGSCEPTVHVVRGRKAILGMKDVLEGLSASCEQWGAMDDLDYFLSRPGALKKSPVLLLISKSAELKESDPLGALILYEYKVAGIPTGVYSTDDSTGRRTLVAAAESRGGFAALACKTLMDSGARTVLVTFRGEQGVTDWSNQRSQFRQGLDAWGPIVAMTKSNARKAVVERENLGYLPIGVSFEDTMTGLGNKTRKHMRYYRRRAEQVLGSEFCAEVKISKAEFVAMNRQCMYPVPDSIAAWRYDSLQRLKTPVFVGIRDRDGQWLSLVGGRLFHGVLELQWQMNRSSLAAYSLGTVMRSYLLEHGIALGAREFFIQGGTNHSMRNGFVNEGSIDVVVQRHGVSSLLIRRLAKYVMPEENLMGRLLSDETVEWRAG